MPPITSLYSYLLVSILILLHSPQTAGQFLDEPPYEIVSVNVSEPTNNAPLDTSLVYYRLNGFNGPSDTLTHGYVTVPCGANMSVHYTNPGVFPDAGTPERPILLLNHGYPESSYIWRYVAPVICSRVPCIIPDRPGYGLSTVCPNGTDMRTNAGALIDIVVQLYGANKTVILAGHDRGGRSMQRAAVDIGQGGFPQIKAAGLFIQDIVPIIIEFGSFSNPANAIGYFHWVFLPRTQDHFSLDVVMGYGGGNWATYVNQQGSGINQTAIDLFQAGNAFAIYKNFFDQVSVTNASIGDYYDAATSDYDEMKADQAAGRKIKMPTHIQYSKYNLETLAGFDVPAIWAEFVDPSAGLTTEAVCCGQGHFVPELAPQQTIDQLNQFLDRLGVNPGL